MYQNQQLRSFSNHCPRFQILSPANQASLVSLSVFSNARFWKILQASHSAVDICFGNASVFVQSHWATPQVSQLCSAELGGRLQGLSVEQILLWHRHTE